LGMAERIRDPTPAARTMLAVRDIWDLNMTGVIADYRRVKKIPPFFSRGARSGGIRAPGARRQAHDSARVSQNSAAARQRRKRPRRVASATSPAARRAVSARFMCCCVTPSRA